MKPIEFPEVNQTIGQGQEDKYDLLPAKIIVNQQVPIWSCWRPSEEDLKKLNEGGSIWVGQMSFGSPFQPTKLTTDKPDFDKLDKEADEETDRLILEINEKYKKGDIDLTADQAKELRGKMKARNKGKGFKKGEKHTPKLDVKKGGRSGSK